jgi:hypothetical protein
MVVSLAVEKVLVFYASADLKTWTELSRFGPAGTPQKPNWECPDLFELPIEGEEGRTLWVLEVDMGSGAIAGGSGGEYFVGEFDGRSFTPLQQARWVDFGRDFYAPVSWSNIPESDGRRIWIGWFNNWQTCLVPTSPWRSCMSVPRTLSLRQIERMTPQRHRITCCSSGLCRNWIRFVGNRCNSTPARPRGLLLPSRSRGTSLSCALLCTPRSAPGPLDHVDFAFAQTKQSTPRLDMTLTMASRMWIAITPATSAFTRLSPDVTTHRRG